MDSADPQNCSEWRGGLEEDLSKSPALGRGKTGSKTDMMMMRYLISFIRYLVSVIRYFVTFIRYLIYFTRYLIYYSRYLIYKNTSWN